MMRMLRGLLPFGVIVVAWVLVTRGGLVPEIFLPRPEDVARTGWEMMRDGSLWTNIGASLGRVLFGVVVSVPLAVAAGVAVGLSRRLAAVLEPVAGFFNSLSGIAWLPLAVTWFGLRQGGHPNPALKAAWAAHGEEAFAFDVLEEVDTDELGPVGRDSLLKARTAHWREALRATKIVG